MAGFFGVRGSGSTYHLPYAAGQESFPAEQWLWSTVGFTIVLSVFVHGVAATRRWSGWNGAATPARSPPPDRRRVSQPSRRGRGGS